MATEHLNLVDSKLDKAFYLEQPFIGYDFIKLPRFSFEHNEPIEFNENQLSDVFIKSFKACIRNLYPLYLKPNATDNILTCRWTNLFLIHGSYLIVDKNDNKLCCFLINNNDTAENYLQAFCELFKFVDIDKTKEALQRLNKNLYDYLNIDYVVLEINKMGVFQATDIITKGQSNDN